MIKNYWNKGKKQKVITVIGGFIALLLLFILRDEYQPFLLFIRKFIFVILLCSTILFLLLRKFRKTPSTGKRIGILGLLLVIFGVIYGRDAIDRTWKKNPNEGVVESFTEDVKQYYYEDKKRLFKLIALGLSIVTFLGTLTYWVLTNYDIAKMIGLTQ